jgi:trimeric autotransporter adhesin
LYGNVYIADSDNNCIRRVDINGMIRTVAGTGIAGYAGDGGAATSAQLASPSDVAIDGLGNLYIADSNNHRIRKVDTNGIVTTVAGNGSAGYLGDGSAATSAARNRPTGVSVDGMGNIYIADVNNNSIRRVDGNGIISTVAGTGTAGYAGDGSVATNALLHSPVDVVVDGSGNLFVADTSNNCIRRVDSNGIITTVAGTGIAGYTGDGGAATAG